MRISFQLVLELFMLNMYEKKGKNLLSVKKSVLKVVYHLPVQAGN